MVNFSFLVGRGIGPRTWAPVRRAVSTISSVDASIRRWSKAFSRIRIRWFCTVHLLKTAGIRGGPRKKSAKSTDVVGGCQQLKRPKIGGFRQMRLFSQRGAAPPQTSRIGRSLTRCPVAASTALPIAGATGMKGGSPNPLGNASLSTKQCPVQAHWPFSAACRYPNYVV